MRTRPAWPALALLVGAAASGVTLVVAVRGGATAKELPWVAATVVFLASAAVVWRWRREHPLARWFAVAGASVAVVQALDAIVLRLGAAGQPRLLASVLLAYQLGSVVAVAAVTRMLGLFPDGRVERRYERAVLTHLWWLLALPPLVLLGRPLLLTPAYHATPATPNPFHVTWLTPVGAAAGVGTALTQGVFVVGVALLVLRYRRAREGRRRQVRWLLVPGLLAAGAAVVDLLTWRLFPHGAPTAVAEVGLTALWVAAIASLPLAIAVAVVRPELLDVDRVIRKSLVYGALWAAIAGVYVAATAALGLIAGRRLPLDVAITLAVGAAVLFQPARNRLERLADRWVFGVRADPARLVERLGAALEDTVELESLLPRMADTLQEGLGLRWARVRLDGASPSETDQEAALLVPIRLGEEQLGVIECGPKAAGPLTAEDVEVVSTFARQAALAVRNLRLATELDQSRARLVRAHDTERRRLERNLHDGVQQHLIALIGHTGHVRRVLRSDPAAGEQALAELQDGLRLVMAELRELAHGIHPSVLSDRGLLEAVEALALRSALPVDVRAEASLRGLRLPEDIEGAGYFTVAEALANVGKHAHATRAEVHLGASEGALRIEVRDDGDGFDLGAAAGEGLRNLAERLAALGGHLDIDSRPGQGTRVTAVLRDARG